MSRSINVYLYFHHVNSIVAVLESRTQTDEGRYLFYSRCHSKLDLILKSVSESMRLSEVNPIPKA